MSKLTSKPKRYTGRAVTIIFEKRDFSRVVILDIEDDLVVGETLVTNPDMTQITVARAEEALWDIVEKAKEGY